MLVKISKFLVNEEKTKNSNSSQQSEVFDFLSLVKNWEKIVGPRLAQHSVPLKKNKDILTILIDHSAFAQQISFIEGPLKAKIATFFPILKGKIKKIKFQANSHYFAQKKELLEKKILVSKEAEAEKSRIYHQFSPEYKKLKAESLKLLQDIEDDKLKEKLSNIYIQTHHSK